MVEVQSATRAGARATVKFVVRDEQSAVLRVEYSLDASRWRVAYPVDGIPDSRREEFDVTLDDADAARSIIIRVTDAMNNVATAVAEIKSVRNGRLLRDAAPTDCRQHSRAVFGFTVMCSTSHTRLTAIGSVP